MTSIDNFVADVIDVATREENRMSVAEQIMNDVTNEEREEKGMTMSIEEYAGAIAERIDGAEVREVIKENGVIKHGIIVKQTETNIAPTVYADDFYEKGLDVETATKEVLNVITQHSIPGNMDMSWFTDFDKAKTQLMMKLVNKASIKANKDVVYMSAKDYGFEDLVLVPYIRVTSELFGSGRVTVLKEHVKYWKQTQKEVLRIAMENTLADKENGEIVPMTEMLVRMGVPAEMLGMDTDTPFYVVSTKDTVHGAIMAIVMQDEIKEKFPNGYIILPSSVHEVLVLPKDIPQEMMGLAEMIKEVNASCVKPEEILSDRPYEFAA